jgi:hypothetical protein
MAALMAASILNSPRAVAMSVYVTSAGYPVNSWGRLGPMLAEKMKI